MVRACFACLPLGQSMPTAVSLDLLVATLIVSGNANGTPAERELPDASEGTPLRRLSEGQTYATFGVGASCEANGAGSIKHDAGRPRGGRRRARLGLRRGRRLRRRPGQTALLLPQRLLAQVQPAGTNVGDCYSETCICWVNAPPPLLSPLPPPPAAAAFSQPSPQAPAARPTTPSITTPADCEAAAAALGLSATTAEDDGDDGYYNRPPYCYLLYGDALNFNAAGTNTGSCGGTGMCICWRNAPYDPVPPILATALPIVVLAALIALVVYCKRKKGGGGATAQPTAVEITMTAPPQLPATSSSNVVEGMPSERHRGPAAGLRVPSAAAAMLVDTTGDGRADSCTSTRPATAARHDRSARRAQGTAAECVRDGARGARAQSPPKRSGSAR